MGLLGDIYSGTNTFKRKLSDFVQNPRDASMAALNRFSEDQKDTLNTFSNAYPMPGYRTVLNTPEHIKQFRNEVADAATEQGLNSIGVIGARFKGAGTPTNVPGFGKAYEVPDNFSSVAKEPLQEMQHIFKPGNPKLQDVLSHPELYRQYPELAQYPVKPLGLFQRDLHGAYDKGEFFLNRTSKEITKEELEQAHSTLLHEVQHAIQEIDKMPVGGMSSDFITSATKNAKLAATSVKNTIDKQADGILAGTGHEHERMALFAFPEYKKDLIAKFPQLGELVTQRKKADTLYKKISNKETMAFENYRRLAGEAQARAVQTRFKNPEQYQNDVLKSYDVDPNKLFVKRDVSDRPTDIFQDTTYEPPLFPDTTR